jgi:multidrug resistance efflux pump
MTDTQTAPPDPSPPPSAPPPEAPAPAEPAKPERAETKRNPARKITLVVVAILLVMFVYGIFADRITPYTSQATVQAYLVRVAPEITGKVIEIAIEEGAPVSAGDVLFRVDPERYRLAVERAEAQLALAGQDIGASTAAVSAAQAVVSQAKAERDNVREQTDRVFQLVKEGVYAKARGDQATAALKTAEAAVERAVAELEQARQNLGPEGEDNPQVRDAIAALEQAQLDLGKTTIFAPSDGGVPFLDLAVGQVVSAGQPAMTYVDVRQIWIEASFRENSLEHIDKDDLVEVVLDIRPGRVYPARVQSFGYAVATRTIDQQTGLPKINNPSGWFRDPQPMPLRVVFDQETRPKGLRLGSQATVMVYAQDNAFMTALGRFWIRAIAWLTYVN